MKRASDEAIQMACDQLNEQSGTALWDTSDYGYYSLVTKRADEIDRKLNASLPFAQAAAADDGDLALRAAVAWTIVHAASLIVAFGILQYVFRSPPGVASGRAVIVGLLATWVGVVNCWLLRRAPRRVLDFLNALEGTPK